MNYITKQKSFLVQGVPGKKKKSVSHIYKVITKETAWYKGKTINLCPIM